MLNKWYDYFMYKIYGGRWELIQDKFRDSMVMFGNSFCFLFSKTCFWEYKEKTIFLYFWNQKHVWLVEIKKDGFLRKKIENNKIYCY